MFLHTHVYIVADAVNLDNWFIVFQVLMLKVAIVTMFLHLSKLGNE